MTRFWRLVLGCLAICQMAGMADVSLAQTAIQAAYDRACEATRLKFIDGIQAIRARGYTAYGPDGVAVDGSHERETYEKVLSPAIDVKETAEILRFKLQDANHAICQVHDVLLLLTVPRPHQRRSIRMETSSTDDWILTPGGWKLLATHVRQRSLSQRELGASSQPQK